MTQAPLGRLETGRRPEDSIRLRTRRNALWTIAIGAATAVVVFLLILVGLNVLVLPASTPSPVEVTEVRWTILQGMTASGFGWFGPSQFNYTTNGFPTNETPGGSMTLTVTLANFDTVNHTIYSVVAVTPFSVTSVLPSVPRMVPHSDDNALFQIEVAVPNDPGQSFPLQLTINAIGTG